MIDTQSPPSPSRSADHAKTLTPPDGYAVFMSRWFVAAMRPDGWLCEFGGVRAEEDRNGQEPLAERSFVSSQTLDG